MNMATLKQQVFRDPNPPTMTEVWLCKTAENDLFEVDAAGFYVITVHSIHYFELLHQY